MRFQFENLSMQDHAAALNAAHPPLPHPPPPPPPPPPPHDARTAIGRDETANAYYLHSNAQRVNTDMVIVNALRQQYPRQKVTVVVPGNFLAPVQLLKFASDTGRASYRPVTSVPPRESSSPPPDHHHHNHGRVADGNDDDDDDADADRREGSGKDLCLEPLEWKQYVPPARRSKGGDGVVATAIKFGRFVYTYKGHDLTLYLAEGRDGQGGYPAVTNQYLVHADDAAAAALVDELMTEAGLWASQLHSEIWVFDGGFWRKDAELWRSIQPVSWDDVILPPALKEALRDDVRRFFNGRERYEQLHVAWKRGVIYHGPPGNGKTVSIKALMHELYRRQPEAVPTLYVRSFIAFGGPEFAVKQIFAKARAEAPCLLVFEDLDSLVTDQVRSYFLNEVDGLVSNEGVMMIGSTNHLERLDPGLSKRPSRFDRKFLFDKPGLDGRTRYARFWRHKLADNDAVDFPDELCPKMAEITDGFSFAYMQEAYIATLLTIASHQDDDDDEDDDEDEAGARTSTRGGKARRKAEEDPFDRYILWREFKVQVKNLREEM